MSVAFISRMFYKASASPAGALFFSCLVTGYILAFTLPLHFLPHSHTMKIVYTACSWIPMIFTWWFLLRGFIWPIFNNKKNDDQHANIFSYAYAIAAKTVAMSTIYMIIYMWSPSSFEVLSVDSSRLNTWGMFISMSTYLSAGTAPPATFDTTGVLSALISALDLYVSWFLNFTILVTVVTNGLKKIESRSVRSKDDDEEN